MRILILGGDGMLGHRLFLTLRENHDVRVTLRQDLSAYKKFNLFNSTNSYVGINVCDTDSILNVLSDFQPDAVINAVGIVKQRKDAKEIIPSLEVNSIFPHRLAQLCKIAKCRLIHMSTDCVFTGNKGNYTEDDVSDAQDLYGKSKYLGELHEQHCVTLRSSIIGLELTRKTSLVEWFLAQRGNIKGFRRAIYSGLTTHEMSRLIECILVKHKTLFGLWHVSSESAINKFDLLSIMLTKLGRHDIQITPDENFVCDRSLIGDRFKKATGYQSPTWEAMLGELCDCIQSRERELCY